MKNKNEKGFTLAELLIVVAIIGVLVAISIPVFSKHLQKVRLAVNQANAKAAEEACAAEFMSSDAASTLSQKNISNPTYFYDVSGWSIVYIYNTSTGDIDRENKHNGSLAHTADVSHRNNTGDAFWKTIVDDSENHFEKPATGPSGWTINTGVFSYDANKGYTMGKHIWKYFAISIDVNGKIQGYYASVNGNNFTWGDH